MKLARRGIVLRLTLVYVLVSLALLNGSAWFFYVKTAQYLRDLEDGLGRRLRVTAESLARRLDGFHLSVLRPGDERHIFFQQTQRWLDDEREDHGLEAIVVLGPDYRVRVSSRERSLIGDFFDQEAATEADLAETFAGKTVVTPVTVVHGEWHKAACAPVFDPEQRIVAAVVARASAQALAPLRENSEELFHFVLAIAGMSLVAAAVLSTVIVVTLRALLREQEALRRSERLALAGTLAAGVAHEVRNPLGVISGMAELLAERSPRESREAALARDILAEVGRLNRVVGDFLDFSRPAPPQVQTVTPAELWERPLGLLRASLERHKIKIVTDATAAVPRVLADPGRIQQVVLNLLLNARDAMPSGGTLTFRARSEGDAVALSVTDTGEGITADHLTRVFEPFFTTKERGTGLGLAVARRIVEEHGGKIQVESKPGTGTTFTMILPVAKER